MSFVRRGTVSFFSWPFGLKQHTNLPVLTRFSVGIVLGFVGLGVVVVMFTSLSHIDIILRRAFLHDEQTHTCIHYI